MNQTEHSTVQRREVAQGVLVYEGEDGMPNAVALIGRNHLLVIDSLFTPRHARQMLDDLRTLTDLPVTALVNTHFHGDHTLGNRVIPTDRILAPRGVADRLRSKGKAYLDLLCCVRADLKPEIEHAEWLLPTEELDSPTSIDLGGMTACLCPVGETAHTEADLYVWIPERRVLIASDLIFNGILPVARDGEPEGWRAALRALKTFDIDVLVPGHGPIGGPQLIDQQLAVFEAIETAVHSAESRGEDAAAGALSSVSYLLHAEERIQPYVTWFTTDGEDL